ncbi:hypothetical protein [Microbacterium invictum]|uniref:Uncharacterized protein n=1 Tax=Microbacterium invictum TaxID=515415 RepID=A0AA40SR82_9MICO|nr:MULTISPECIES: hypothetical protein [Microbacterium]MBB4140760.1 hypothetical protein [Microbacterium invictum]
MKQFTSPVAGESLAEAAERIRAAVPIEGDTATDLECRWRRQMIDATLAARGVVGRTYEWHTAQLDDGRIAGVFAESTDEAELSLTVWWGNRCHWVIADPTCLVRAEYLPRGIRTAATADRRFPLGPPRRVRDQFATAESLLDRFALPDHSSALER